MASARQPSLPPLPASDCIGLLQMAIGAHERELAMLRAENAELRKQLRRRIARSSSADSSSGGRSPSSSPCKVRRCDDSFEDMDVQVPVELPVGASIAGSGEGEHCPRVARPRATAPAFTLQARTALKGSAAQPSSGSSSPHLAFGGTPAPVHTLLHKTCTPAATTSPSGGELVKVAPPVGMSPSNFEERAVPIAGMWVDPRGDFFGGAVVCVSEEGWWRPQTHRSEQLAEYTWTARSHLVWDFIEHRPDEYTERRFTVTRGQQGQRELLVVSLASADRQWTLHRADNDLGFQKRSWWTPHHVSVPVDGVLLRKSAAPRTQTVLNYHNRSHSTLGSWGSVQLASFRNRSCIMHPMGKWCALIDGLGLLVILCDTLLIPFQIAFFEFTQSIFVLDVVNRITQIWWNLDILFTFNRGYYDKKGDLVMSFRQIKDAYMRSWFTFDVSIVALDWTLLVLETEAARSAGMLKIAKIFRILRILRVLRLLKLAKSGRMRALLEDLSCSELFGTSASLLRVLCVIGVICHMIACLWYWVGQTTGNSGWVAKTFPDDATWEYRYFTSCHWAITQFGVGTTAVEARNTRERVVSIAVLFSALIIFSCLVSTATNALTQYTQRRAEHFRQLDTFRKFCFENRIPKLLFRRLQVLVGDASNKRQQATRIEDVALLEHVSKPMKGEVMYYVYKDYVEMSPLLLQLGCFDPSRVLLHRLALEALTSTWLAKGDWLFNERHQLDQALFIVNGLPEYIVREKVIEVVSEPCWVCEPALWTTWVCLGSLLATTECQLVELSSEKLATVAGGYPDAMRFLQLYAEVFVQELNRALSSRRPQQRASANDAMVMENSSDGGQELSDLRAVSSKKVEELVKGLIKGP